jgi:hypothetical protein
MHTFLAIVWGLGFRFLRAFDHHAISIARSELSQKNSSQNGIPSTTVSHFG